MFSVIIIFALSYKLSIVATSSPPRPIANRDVMSDVLGDLPQPARLNLAASNKMLFNRHAHEFMKEKAAVAELSKMMLNESIPMSDINDTYWQARQEYAPYLLYFHKLLHRELPHIIKTLSQRSRSPFNIRRKFVSERLSAIGVDIRRFPAINRHLVFASAVLCDIFYPLRVNETNDDNDPIMVLAAAIYYKALFSHLRATKSQYGLLAQTLFQDVILWEQSVIDSDTVNTYVTDALEHRSSDKYDLGVVLSWLASLNSRVSAELTAEILLEIIQTINKTKSVNFDYEMCHSGLIPMDVYTFALDIAQYLFGKRRRDESRQIIGLLYSFTHYRETFRQIVVRNREFAMHVREEIARCKTTIR